MGRGVFRLGTPFTTSARRGCPLWPSALKEGVAHSQITRRRSEITCSWGAEVPGKPSIQEPFPKQPFNMRRHACGVHLSAAPKEARVLETKETQATGPSSRSRALTKASITGAGEGNVKTSQEILVLTCPKDPNIKG